jgi:heat shock protein HslJ
MPPLLNRTARGAAGLVFFGDRMTSFARKARAGIASLLLAAALQIPPAKADDGFPFEMQMQLDVNPMRGSKRIPNLDIGEAGEVVFELWCKGGKGQFSVAGNTVIFVAGAMENRSCPPDRAQADDDLIAALTDVATWKRQDDLVTFMGTKTLRFRINTN